MSGKRRFLDVRWGRFAPLYLALITARLGRVVIPREGRLLAGIPESISRWLGFGGFNH